jgi:signal transduction histidine kinase/ActR/RegA family two-component response regulator
MPKLRRVAACKNSCSDGSTVGSDHILEIRAAQVRMLYEQVSSALIATSVNAIILSTVLWRQVPGPLLSGWLVAVLLVALARHRLSRTYLRNVPTTADCAPWKKYCTYGVAASGALWGFAGFFFFTPNSYPHQAFLAFVLAGMASGGVVTLSPMRGLCPMFLLLALIPYATRLVSAGGDLHLAMGIMTVLYLSMMWVISSRVYLTVTESLRLRFANVDLVRNLTQAKERQEIANQELAAQIAEKRQAQDALQRAYVELEQRVQERTEELTKSEMALRDADRRKDEFLAMLGHEFRNPLAPIQNVVQLMKKLGVSDSMVKWGRDVIDRQVDHLSRLVDDLLDVSHIVQGKISLEENILNVATVIDHAVEASRPVIEARAHALSVSVPDKPIWVRGDAVRLTQVISNLLNNAAKYTDVGGRIQLSTETTREWVTLRVQDNGIGIPPNVLPYVFDLFTRADHTLARTQSGLGIGLTVVKRLIERHRGHVEVRSGGPGCGSEFLVHLPRQEAPAQPRVGSPSAEAVTGREQALRILVVDDNQDAAESLAFLLRLEGHDVAMAFDGAAALVEAARFQPQAVLLDVGMPGMDGYQVVRQLRTRESTRSAVILALTGYGQPEDKARAKAAGFTDHLTKPVDPRLVMAMVKSHATQSGA